MARLQNEIAPKNIKFDLVKVGFPAKNLQKSIISSPQGSAGVVAPTYFGLTRRCGLSSLFSFPFVFLLGEAKANLSHYFHISSQGKANHPKNTHAKKNSLHKQFGQTLSACFLPILKGTGGTVCTHCPEVVCVNCVFIWVGGFFGRVVSPQGIQDLPPGLKSSGGGEDGSEHLPVVPPRTTVQSPIVDLEGVFSAYVAFSVALVLFFFCSLCIQHQMRCKCV